MSPGLSNLVSPEDLEDGTKSVLRGKEAQDCEEPFASACRWMLYHRRHRSITGDSIPVSQQMTELRERALCHLLLLDKKGQLEKKIRLLVRTPPQSKDLVAMGDEKPGDDESQGYMEAHIAGTHDGHISVSGTPVGDQGNATIGSAGISHETDRPVAVGAEQSKIDPQAIDGRTMDKEEESKTYDDSQYQVRSLASATQVKPVGSIHPNDAHADRDGADGRDLHCQPTTAIKPQFDHSTTSSRTGPAGGGLHPTYVNTHSRKATTESVTQLSASQLKTVSTILDAIRSAMTTSNYVKRFDMLLSTWSELSHAFEHLSASAARRMVMLNLQPKEMAKSDSTFGPALTRFAKFSVECNKLDRLTDHGSRRSDVIDIYEMLPHNHRLELENVALARPSTSSILRFDGPGDTSFTASVALATAEWDTVIYQAWPLNVDVVNRYEALTARWFDKALRLCQNQKKRLDLRREFQLDTELAATALINEGLYKAPESSELDTLLTKEVRKVCLL